MSSRGLINLERIPTIVQKFHWIISNFFLPFKGLKKMALGGATYSLTQGEATYHKLVWFTILIMDS